MLKNYLCSRPLGERDIEFLYKKRLSCAFGAKNYKYIYKYTNTEHPKELTHTSQELEQRPLGLVLQDNSSVRRIRSTDKTYTKTPKQILKRGYII